MQMLSAMRVSEQMEAANDLRYLVATAEVHLLAMADQIEAMIQVKQDDEAQKELQIFVNLFRLQQCT